MANYNFDSYPATLVLSNNEFQAAMRSERHYNPLAISGLAVGDTVFANISVPKWARTIIVSKRTNTANGDVLTVTAQEINLPVQPALPLKTSPTVQTTGATSNSASNTVQMQLYPIGNTIQLSLQIITGVPAQCVLSCCFYDY